MPEKKGMPLFYIVCALFLVLIIPHSFAEPVTDQNSSLELKYDSDSASYSFYSLGNGGHAVYFDNPGSITITGIKIFGKMYGNSPDNPVHVRLWDKNFNNIYAYDITYKDFPQSDASWITVPVPPLLRTGDFYASVFTQSAPQGNTGGGVSIGYDTSTKSGHSHILSGGNNKRVQDVNIGPNKTIPPSMIDWKIRILYSAQPPAALTTAAQTTQQPAVQQPAAQQQGIPISLLMVVVVVVLAVTGISAVGYYKYRKKSRISAPQPAVLDSQIPSDDGHHDVFISYAHVDKPTADAVCARLESQNIRCWIAPRDVPPGKNFPEAIIDGIEGSKIMVLIFSSHSNASEHVIREVTKAISKSLLIIPFRIEDVQPTKSMDYLIGTPHWLDAISPPLDQHIDKLITTIKNFLSDRKPAN
ncbi:MAG: toll/interleukin-1 receptor domain-containing protein [Methanoregula sp.]|uniref:toll/interleukin-1 receptor domain-containing protein n=1 Tax=Methanoregula sp. TaxID=2052170 RepID=UPI003C233E49